MDQEEDERGLGKAREALALCKQVLDIWEGMTIKATALAVGSAVGADLHVDHVRLLKGSPLEDRLVPPL